MFIVYVRLQTTQPTSGRYVTTVLASCCASCVETSLSQQLQRTAGWQALLLIKMGDVETNIGPKTIHTQLWICNIGHKQIHDKNQISIRCNRMRRYPPSTIFRYQTLIRLAQYSDTWTCHLHK